MKSIIALIAVALTIAAVNGSAYAPGLKGPPCPKSVVVSCAPLVQSVPCKSSGMGPHGAYSEQYSQYAAPVQEVQEEYAPAASEYVPNYLVPRYSPSYRYY